MKSLLLILLFLSTTIFPQKWNYLKNENVFDGDSKLAFIDARHETGKANPVSITVAIGEGIEIPAVYFTNVSVENCDRKWIKIKFDNDDKLYAFWVLVLSDNTTWFAQEAPRQNASFISLVDFLIKMKQKQKMHVRFDSDCGHSDYEFSLDGSTDAINYVAADFIKTQQPIEKKLAAANKLIEEKKAIADKLIDSGKPFKTTTRYRASIFSYPESSSFYNDITLAPGEEVVVSFKKDNDGFYVLHEASSVILPSDSIFYLSPGSVDLETVEEVK